MGWRDEVLKEFAPETARLTLVADPDGLLLEEGVLQGIRERGYDLIPFDDAVAFRYAYESDYRSRWDQGEPTELVVVLHSPSHDLQALPFDLLQVGRKLSFSLGALFPGLSYPVLNALDRADLDAVYEAQARHNPGQLGDNATKEFVLRHVFQIAPELVKEPSDLLRVLLRRHYHEQHVPPMLDEHLIRMLRADARFIEWPLEKIVPDRAAFLSFLQQRWPRFIRANLGRQSGAGVAEDPPAFGLEPPFDLPFDHPDVRVVIDNLFLEDLLKPVDVQDLGSSVSSSDLGGVWYAVGIRTDPAEDRVRRLEKLLEAVQDAVPAESARHQDWLTFAPRWAELAALWHQTEVHERGTWQSTLGQLQAAVDDAFALWMTTRYASLHSLPSVRPVMLHHITRALASMLSRGGPSSGADAGAMLREGSGLSRLALVVIDGLAMDQWVVLREALSEQQPSFVLRESAVFAWVPTLTSVSRQALFAGTIPLYFPGSIYSTDKEPTLWTKFWADQGLAAAEVAYARGLGEDGSLTSTEHILGDHRVRVVGLVIDKVDKIMHGMQLGTAGMHNQVRQWAQGGFLAAMLGQLLSEGFDVFVTSDHGNIEAVGWGRPSEGALADQKGERVRIYPDASLRSEVRERFPTAIEWPRIGLPDGFLPLISPGRSAFVTKGERTVAHGGISLEEVVVPFARVENRS